MSYLSDLVKTFTETELEQFRKLDLIGKEAAVQDAFVRNFSAKKKVEEAALREQLGLTESHYDKINSVLLVKTIQHLWDDDYLLILQKLRDKELIRLLYHQIKLYEKQVLTTAETKKIIRFYEAVIETQTKIRGSHYDSEAAHSYKTKYLAVLGNAKTFEDEVRVEMLLFMRDIHKAMTIGGDKNFIPEAKQKFALWEQKIAGQPSPVAHLFYGFALSWFHKFFTDDPQELIDTVEFSLKNYAASNGKIACYYAEVLQSDLGTGYLAQNNFVKALQIFDTVMTTYPDTAGKAPYQQALWFHAAVIAGDYLKAHRIFEEKYRVRTFNEYPANTRADAYMVRFFLALHERDYDSADEWMKRLILLPKDQLSDMIKSLYRVCETALHYFTSDKETALLVSTRHFNYWKKRLKEIPSNFYWHYQFIECAHLLLRYANGKHSLHEKTEKAVSELKTGVYSMYNNLLRDEWKRLRIS